MDKFCAYCDDHLFYSSIYGCSCNPKLLVCNNCSKIQCPECNGKMKKVSVHRCRDCSQYLAQSELIDHFFERYCYNCCVKALEKIPPKSRMVEFRSHSKVQRSHLEMFLKLFCSKCQKKLTSKQVSEFEHLRLKYQQRLCSGCSGKQLNSKTQQKEIKKPSDQKQGQQQLLKQEQNKEENKQQKKQQKKEENKQQQEKNEKKHLSKQELYNLWRQKQNVSAYGHVKCVSCNFTIFQHETDSIITQQMAICGTCINGSKIEENSMTQVKKRKQIKEANKLIKKAIAQNRPELDYFMADRSIKDSQKMKQKKFEQVREVKTEKKSISNSIINKIKTQEKKKEDQRNSAKDEGNKNQKLKMEIPQQQSEEKKAEKQNSSQQFVILQESPKNSKPIKKAQSPQLKRSDSESRLQNIKLTLNWAPDNEIVYCSECGLVIQAINSIWEQQANAPFCKCCFSDYLERLRQQMRKREYQKKMRYAPKIMDSEPSKASTDARIGHEILSKTQQKGRSKPKLIQMDDYDKAAKTDTIIFSNTSPSRQQQHLPSKLRENSNSKQAQSRENSSNNSSNKNNYLRQDRAFGEPMQAMPNTKRLDQLNRSNVNLDGPRMQPHSRPAYNYLNQQKYFKRCYKCNNYSYLSNKYLIGQLPVCVQCFGKHSMQKMQKDKLKAT